MNTGKLIAVAVAAAAHAAAAPVIADGRQAYLESCAACHGLYAGGDGPAIAALAVPVPDLRRLAAREGGSFPLERVARVIDGREMAAAHGDRTMPVWGSEFWLQEGCDNGAEQRVSARIQDLVGYLASIQLQD